MRYHLPSFHIKSSISRPKRATVNSYIYTIHLENNTFKILFELFLSMKCIYVETIKVK